MGFDWLLLFLHAHLHNSTVVRAARIVVTMLSSSPALARFKEGLGNGGWLHGTDIMLNKTTYVVAGKSSISISGLTQLSACCLFVDVWEISFYLVVPIVENTVYCKIVPQARNAE